MDENETIANLEKFANDPATPDFQKSKALEFIDRINMLSFYQQRQRVVIQAINFLNVCQNKGFFG